MRNIAYLIIIVLSLGACSSSRKAKSNLIQVPVMSKIIVKPRLIPVQMAGDSVLLRLLFECDSNNKIVLKKLAETKSKGVSSDFSLNDGLFSYKANTKGCDTAIIVNDSIVIKEVPVEVPVPNEVNILTGWQWFQIWLGRILGGLLLIFVGFKIAKIFLKIPGI